MGPDLKPINNSGARVTRGRPGVAAGRERSGRFRRLSLTGRVVVVCGVGLMVLAVFFAEENWRGGYAWDRCRQNLESRGVELNWRNFAPPAVPDEDNFAKTPFLAPLFDFNPVPLRPGQTRWRDAAGHERATKFAAELSAGDDSQNSVSLGLNGRLIDLGAALQTLRPNTGAVTNASRTELAKMVLLAMEDYQPVLEELRAASSRRYCRFGIEYEARDPLGILLPHLAVLRNVGKALHVRAAAELADGRSGAALADTKLIFYLVDSIQGEPLLISFLVRRQMLKMASQIIWEGLSQRSWSEAELTELEERLSRLNLVNDLRRGLEAERAGFGSAIFSFVRGHKDVLRSWIGSGDGRGLGYLLAGPNGWFYQEQVSYQTLYDTRVLSGIDFGRGTFRPGTIQENQKALEKEFEHYVWHHTAFSRLLLPNLSNLLLKAAANQTLMAEAKVACALERYRMSKKAYPTGLDGLAMGTVSSDPCTGGALKYQLTSPDQFTLYGVGWNEKDDGGSVAAASGTADNDSNEGDWVWPRYAAEGSAN